MIAAETRQLERMLRRIEALIADLAEAGILDDTTRRALDHKWTQIDNAVSLRQAARTGR